MSYCAQPECRVQGEQGYLYAAAAVFGLMVSWVNQYPMLYKHKVMRLSSGNLRANMMIYKELGAKGDAPYIGLETDGPVGCYNRANRSLFHFSATWPVFFSQLCVVHDWSIALHHNCAQKYDANAKQIAIGHGLVAKPSPHELQCAAF